MKSNHPSINGDGNRPKGNLKHVKIDVDKIASIDHCCIGCSTLESCCCTLYEVCVDENELRQIIKYFPKLARYCSHLKNKVRYDNIFEEVDEGLYAIDKADNGLCVLAYRIGKTIRCSLHTLALKQDIPLNKIKPKVCLLWPFYLKEGRSDMLSIHDDAFSFKCNKRREKERVNIFDSLHTTMVLIYGKDYKSQLKIRTI